jgi:hypothetical protein
MGHLNVRFYSMFSAAGFWLFCAALTSKLNAERCCGFPLSDFNHRVVAEPNNLL